jgi:hypothetical protein
MVSGSLPETPMSASNATAEPSAATVSPDTRPSSHMLRWKRRTRARRSSTIAA